MTDHFHDALEATEYARRELIGACLMGFESNIEFKREMNYWRHVAWYHLGYQDAEFFRCTSMPVSYGPFALLNKMHYWR